MLEKKYKGTSSSYISSKVDRLRVRCHKEMDGTSLTPKCFLTWPKFFQHSVIGCCAWLVHLMAQLVTVNPNCTQGLQLPDDGALSTAAASRQTNHIWKWGEMGCVLIGEMGVQSMEREKKRWKSFGNSTLKSSNWQYNTTRQLQEIMNEGDEMTKTTG